MTITRNKCKKAQGLASRLIFYSRTCTVYYEGNFRQTLATLNPQSLTFKMLRDIDTSKFSKAYDKKEKAVFGLIRYFADSEQKKVDT